ncbi:MAG: exonuclease domain-containing protein, partial [Bacteroidota bacterium]
MEGFDWLARLKNAMRARKTATLDESWPQWYQDYFLGGDFSRGPSTLLYEIPIIVLDSETTGLDVQKDRVLSIGALRVRGNVIAVADQFEAYLPTPSSLRNEGAVTIHGIIPNSQRYLYSDENELLKQLL